MERSIAKEAASENNSNKMSLHLLTVSHHIDPNDNNPEAVDAYPDISTNDVPDDNLLILAFLLGAAEADQ